MDHTVDHLIDGEECEYECGLLEAFAEDAPDVRHKKAACLFD